MPELGAAGVRGAGPSTTPLSIATPRRCSSSQRMTPSDGGQTVGAAAGEPKSAVGRQFQPADRKVEITAPGTMGHHAAVHRDAAPVFL